MTPPSTVVRRRQPRLCEPSRQRDPKPGVWPRPHGELACQSGRSGFADAERAVEAITHLGVSPLLPSVIISGRHTPVGKPISEVLEWCAECPFRAACYQAMTAGTYRYTGIAGGVILHQGRPYEPRIRSVQRAAAVG